MIMTLDDIRRMLGFKPHAEFEYEQLLTLAERMHHVQHDVAVRERFRRTGRTTEMLLGAMYAAIGSQCNVLVVAHSLSMMRHMRDTIVSWLKKLNITPQSVSDSMIVLSTASSVTFVSATDDKLSELQTYDLTYSDHVVEGTL